MSTDRLLFVVTSNNQMVDDPDWDWDNDGAQ